MIVSRSASILGIVGFTVLSFAVAGVGGGVTGPSIPTWYSGLTKPAFNPPNWIFGPVWTLLYAFMSVAAWRVWRIGGFRGAQAAMGLFFGQLALNLAWTLIFFGAHSIGWALADIGALWLAVAATMVLFWRRDRVAGALFVPYLAWISFAAALNFAIWRLNG